MLLRCRMNSDFRGPLLLRLMKSDCILEVVFKQDRCACAGGWRSICAVSTMPQMVLGNLNCALESIWSRYIRRHGDKKGRRVFFLLDLQCAHTPRTSDTTFPTFLSPFSIPPHTSQTLGEQIQTNNHDEQAAAGETESRKEEQQDHHPEVGFSLSLSHSVELSSSSAAAAASSSVEGGRQERGEAAVCSTNPPPLDRDDDPALVAASPRGLPKTQMRGTAWRSA